MMIDTQQSVEAASIADQAAHAETYVLHAHSKIVGENEIMAMRQQMRQFLDDAKLSSTARSMALTKLDEMIFWIRSGNLPG